MRFLIVGLGSIGQRHARNLKALHPKANFVFLRHVVKEDDFTRSLGARVVGTLQDALQQSYDLVVVSSPSANHIDVLPQLIATGMRLLIEKPIVTTLEDCQVIKQALENARPGVRVSGFNFRYLPSLNKIRDLIAQGSLGTIIRASFTAGQWLPDWRPTQDYTQSYSADMKRGGGVEFDLVHELDVARWFFGDMKLEYVLAAQKSSLKIQSHDVSLMTMRSADGGPFVHVALDYVSRQRLRRYEIVGSEGSLIWDLQGHVQHITSKGVQYVTQDLNDFDVGETYLTMLRAIQGTSIEDMKHVQSLEDGIASSILAISAVEMGQKT